MLSHSGKKLFSVLDWIRILCSGCFGTVRRSQRPLSVQSSPFSTLSSNVKLDLTMGNLSPHRNAAQEDGKKSNTAHPRPDIQSLAWKFSNEPGNDDDDDDVTFDDATAESDKNDGMFHGLFYLGSKVLTEVEMQSPVEESKIIATPIRTPKRSNNSSCASSTRELDFGSSQVCLVDSDSCSLSDAIAVVYPCQYPTQSSCISPFEDNSANKESISVALCKNEGQHCKPDDDTAGLPSCKESNGNLDEENMQPLLEPSQADKQFSQSGTLWNNRNCQANVGLPPECRNGNPSLGQPNNACAFRYRAAGKSSVSEGLQAEIPVGSLPDGSKTNIISRGWGQENDGGRRARSLTDEDFNELRGCIDLGFVFTQDHIPDLCETLPALEVCYAIAHGPISPVSNLDDSKSVPPGSPPISPWKVASPGDQPQQVKTRLRHWAQAVACNLRQAH